MGDFNLRSRSFANRKGTNTSSWLPKSSISQLDEGFHVHGMPFTLDRQLLAARSAKVAAMLKENIPEDLSHFLQDIPVGPETFELVARFCHGYELHFSTENVVPLACIASYLEMNESHSTDNLLKKAFTFFDQRVLPSWNETIKALRTTENILKQAVHCGLVDACLESIIGQALDDPRLLGEPINICSHNDNSTDDDGCRYRPNARRRLFVLDWQSEDLTALSVQLYKPIIYEMNQRGIPSEYVAASLYQYAKRWVFSSIPVGDGTSISERNSQREIIESVEKLLPEDRGLLPCTSLFEMLRFAIVLEASSDCRNNLEIRIGKQLEHATVKDLLIPSQGYAKEVQYDIECVRRILKNFYGNYNGQDVSGYIAVAELVEEFLGEVASDIDLKTSTFTLLAQMAIAAAAAFGTQQKSDGIYRAIDIYLHKHRYLTESEREEVCQVLDCGKMSPEASEHAAQNDQLPVRVVVQVLFAGQLQLRDAIGKECAPVEGVRKEEEEIEKMSNKVMELERECYMMRKVIENGCCSSSRRSQGIVKKPNVSMWREMKRKFGCISSIKDSYCQDKKKKVCPK